MACEVDRRTVLKAVGSVAAGVALSRTGFAAQGANPGPSHFAGFFRSVRLPSRKTTS